MIILHRIQKDKLVVERWWTRERVWRISCT